MSQSPAYATTPSSSPDRHGDWHGERRNAEGSIADGRTHLAYKAEHVVDLKSDLVLAAEIYKADQADTETLVDSVMQAQINLKQAGSEKQIEEVAADKGYHAGHTLELCESVQLQEKTRYFNGLLGLPN